MIEWKGLHANTPYSSANNKTQDDAVVGMQDTIYATGPGYGAYRAIARVHNQSGAVVAEIPLSSGGGQLSAPPPVRILDDSTAYSYSLQVVEGAIPPGGADGVVIRVIGGSAKRFPVTLTQTPDGSISMPGPVEAPNLVSSWPSFKDQLTGSAKNVCHSWGSSTFQYSTETTTAKKWYSDSLLFAAWARHGCPMILGYNGSVGGSTTSQITTKYLAEVSSTAHDVDMLQLGANDLGVGGGGTFATIKTYIDQCVSAGLKAGHRILFVTPHMQLVPGDWAQYKLLSDYYKTLVARWPGRVFLADVWELLNGSGQATPADYLDTLQKHFNQKGSWAAAPAFEKPFRQMFGEMAFTDLPGIGLGESIVTPADPPTGFSNSGSTVTASTGSIDSAGRARTRLTVTANGAGFWYKTTTALELGATYRPVADVEVVSVGQADTAASCGVFMRSEDSIINHSFGNTAREDVNMQPVGTRLRLVGPEFVATAAAVTGSRVGVAIGGPNTVVDVATLAIVKTKSA